MIDHNQGHNKQHGYPRHGEDMHHAGEDAHRAHADHFRAHKAEADGAHAPAAAAGEHAAHPGHDKHAGHSVAMCRDRFCLTLLLTVLTAIWSEMIPPWFGYTAPRFCASDNIPAFYGMIVFVYGGRPYLQRAYRELRDRLPGMMTL